MSREATSPGERRGGETAPAKPSKWRHLLWLLAIASFLVLYLVLPTVHTGKQVTLSYSQFVTDVSAHRVQTIDLHTNGSATGRLTDGSNYTTAIPSQAGENFLSGLQASGVQITAQTTGTSFGSEVLSWAILLLPFALFGYLWYRMSRGAGGGGALGALGVGRSRAKVFDEQRPSTTFADVAGYEGAKQEIREVVDFLQHADRYARSGAVPPRGVLMIGPPGTGKTLLARAVAGEARVPFFVVTGSGFVEMFVGVGAARVRDLFDQARKRAPAIIFIDEIDAIGQKRGGNAVVANDEREQTLNQMLAEMDGFDPATGIVVLAATNRPEVLDPALLRPGRFDRQITIPLPTLPERTEILKVHCADKRLAADVDLDIVARGTPGFSGADLANLVNEAAIVAVRSGREVVQASDFDQARDRILLGRREGSNVLLPDEQHSVAVHEAGHALVAVYSNKADPVAKVTILPAGQTLGVTEQLPVVERHLYGEDYLRATLAVYLGGRASEVLVLGQGSSGASSDLARATDLATKMVREFGLSAKLGPVGYPEGGSVFLGGSGSALSSRPFAEQTQAAIDHEVAELLREAERQATETLEQHRDVLDSLVAQLVSEETVDGAAVYALADRPMPQSGAREPGLQPPSLRRQAVPAPRDDTTPAEPATRSVSQSPAAT